MTVTIDVWFDYICPFSLITRRVLQEALPRQDVVLEWHPFEVNPDCAVEVGEYPRGIWEAEVRPLAERVGVELPSPPGTPLRRSRMAFLGYQFALDHGVGTAYTERVSTAYFHEWADISDPVELTRLAAEVGLDPRAYRAAILSERYTRRHLDAVAEARGRHGVTMVPTVAIGPWRREGVPGKEELLRAVERAAATAPTPTTPLESVPTTVATLARVA
ncbi:MULTISPECIES: DsbA family oxidoreductase [Streptomycetaceae]|uniref:DSBA-like thioredoxin domain-containing protein n=1 Tax=Streptantibioticus cattleyicolor (strain ATCC 35852 / DSM 46488 / JCM 4925 / NBRC 14057 / NRRL 8057) TaxID=1003195 RepID=F8K2X7_STREN|nr:DsbA family protein [Streptantibioticus cattleyicolor]AEW92462.1 hypothetical protein SCATT_00910 [Streptantibioticus cattleyicolor NRRL 8057 = DSM 46488]MYS57269.1 dithiol-disulfide isomerase [Streptomyces sp. SID5468]CCB72826.1 Predicted dithiol-disulfide isomerase involved in polyketide biosynthesis [Streptantibioticus cattleyicolor NRRL 8057 = DSM 46488]